MKSWPSVIPVDSNGVAATLIPGMGWNPNWGPCDMLCLCEVSVGGMLDVLGAMAELKP